MINYHKNKLINQTLDKYYETFSHTLDTADYVPEAYNKKICKYIFKNMKRAFRQIDKDDRKYQSEVRKQEKDKLKLKKQLDAKPKPENDGSLSCQDCSEKSTNLEINNADSNNNS